jgi:RNA polymerase sigma-70 factor (ECF subfamily)
MIHPAHTALPWILGAWNPATESSPNASADDDGDQGLLVQITQGDHNAFATLLARHGDAARTMALRLLRDHDLADDIVQEVFLSVWIRPQAWKPVGRFRSWLLTLVSRRIVDHFRRRQPSLLDEGVLEQDGCDTVWSSAQVTQVEAAVAGETTQILAQCMESLSFSHRMVLQLYYYEGLSLAEAGESLGLSTKASESLLARARSALRRQLDDRWKELVP